MTTVSIFRKFCPKVVVQSHPKASALIVFLHGSGDTGNGLCQWVRDEINQDFSFPHIRVVYPTAPARQYSPMNGMHSTVWFDRKQISPFVAEDDSLHSMGQELSELISTELDKNCLSEDRLIIGGFSMGGCMALHLAYRWHRRVAGVFALSAFLNKESAVFKELEDNDEPKAPLFQCHGERDTLVLYEWGWDTHQRLTELGVPTEFQAFPVLYHQFNKRQILMLKDWILRILPEMPPT